MNTSSTVHLQRGAEPILLVRVRLKFTRTIKKMALQYQVIGLDLSGRSGCLRQSEKLAATPTEQPGNPEQHQ